MKIVKYIGGLGNQMFIYSFQYLLQKHYGETIYADTLYYKDHKFHNGLELENIFDIKLTPANVRDILKLAYYIPNYYLDYHLRRYLPNRKKVARIPKMYLQKTEIGITSDTGRIINTMMLYMMSLCLLSGLSILLMTAISPLQTKCFQVRIV